MFSLLFSYLAAYVSIVLATLLLFLLPAFIAEIRQCFEGKAKGLDYSEQFKGCLKYGLAILLLAITLILPND